MDNKGAFKGSRIVCGLIMLAIFLLPGFSLGAESNTPVMGHDGAGEVVVAKVNGAPINMKMLMKQMLDVAEKKYGRREISELVAMKIKDEAMNLLIVEELAFQKSLAVVGLVPPSEVDDTLAKFVKQKGGEEGLQEYLGREEMSLEELRHKLTRTLTVKKYLDKEINSKITVTDDEVKAVYFGARDKYFVKTEMVQVHKIIFFLNPDESESVEKVRAFKEKIVNEFNNDPTTIPPDGSFIVQENIKLDKIKDAQLYEAAKAVGPFGITEPILVDGTLHLVQLTGFQPEVTKEFDEVRDYLVGELTRRKRQAMVDTWVAGLKKGAQVEIIDVSL